MVDGENLSKSKKKIAKDSGGDNVNMKTRRVEQRKRKATDQSVASKKKRVGNENGMKNAQAGKEKLKSSNQMFFDKLKKMQVNSGVDTESQKTNWKQAKKLSLMLKEERKKKKLTDYEAIVKAKKLWEEVRHDKCPVERKAKLIASLYAILEDMLPIVVFKHDTSRIVQWLLKLGTPLIRISITKNLKSQIKEMLLQKFSRLCVKNMLKYGDKECRSIVFSEIKGHVVKLMSSVVSAPILEFSYSSWATADEKLLFRREFYGKMLLLVNDAEVSSLKDALSLEVKKDVLADTKANILQVISKRVPVSQLMHSIILEFLKLSEESDRCDIIDVLYSQCMELVQTREGAEITMMCCWFTSGKVKKIILKSLREHVKEVCLMQYGYLFLMALLDSVDDTVLLRQTLLSELLDNVIELLSHENGRKVITYLVAHRNPVHFHPQLISLLKTSDSSKFVKKDMDIKRREILEIVMKPLAQIISSDVTPWFQCSSSAMVLMAILTVAKGDMWMEAYRSVASYICEDIEVPLQNQKIALIEHSSFHFVIKKIIKNETDEKSQASLSYQLADHLTREVIWRWMDSNRGCFLLLLILESKNKNASEVLMNKITEEMKRHLGKESSLGAVALKEKLSDLENN